MLDHFLDIYSKLVVGVISFVAPVTSYLLSTYLTERRQILIKLETTRNTIDSILTSEIQIGQEKGMGAREIIKSADRKLRSLETELNKKIQLLNFLNPKLRISWLFTLLFVSIGCLFINSLVRGNVFGMYNKWASLFSLTASCISFLIAIISLLVIALKLIDAKEILLSENKLTENLSENEKIQSVAEVIEEKPPIIIQ